MIRSATPPIGNHVYACWRPEDAALASPGSGSANRFNLQGLVADLSGNLCDLQVSSLNEANVSFRIQTHGLTPVSEGQTVDVVIPPDAIRFLGEAAQ